MNGVTSMDQVIVRKLTELIHSNLDKENFGVNELALAAGMSRSSIHRRLKIIVKKSTSQFIREVRLQKAMEMLQHDVATASEISYKVGFNSPTYFNSCFHQYFGYPPGEVKKRVFAENEVQDEKLSAESIDLSVEADLSVPEEVRLIRFSRRRFLFTLVLLSTIFLLIIWWHISLINESKVVDLSRLRTKDKSIVVLPFHNLSGNPDNRFFTEGLMDVILNHLFQIRELKVISRSTAEHYSGGSRDAREIAKELGVSFILEGSVQEFGGKVRIIVQLIDARHDRHIWSQKYDRELSDIFIIQTAIASQIADQLQSVLSSDEGRNKKNLPSQNH